VIYRGRQVYLPNTKMKRAPSKKIEKVYHTNSLVWYSTY